MSLNLNKISILFADDNDAIRQLSRQVLEELGVGTVIVAKDGEDAFEKFKTGPQDIVISDWEMERMSGPEFLKKIRTSPDSPDNAVPFIMLTGYSASKRVIEARDKGATEFIVKPFSVDQLTKRISQIINKPRNFVEAPGFAGPDRRRRNNPNHQGAERRENKGAID